MDQVSRDDEKKGEAGGREEQYKRNNSRIMVDAFFAVWTYYHFLFLCQLALHYEVCGGEWLPQTKEGFFLPYLSHGNYQRPAKITFYFMV